MSSQVIEERNKSDKIDSFLRLAFLFTKFVNLAHILYGKNFMKYLYIKQPSTCTCNIATYIHLQLLKVEMVQLSCIFLYMYVCQYIIVTGMAFTWYFHAVSLNGLCLKVCISVMCLSILVGPYLQTYKITLQYFITHNTSMFSGSIQSPIIYLSAHCYSDIIYILKCLSAQCHMNIGFEQLNVILSATAI